MSRPTPEELLARVATGDKDAFGLLYPVIAGPALGLARRVVRDTAQAEEVCREALTDVWRHAARFDPARGSAVTWAMTITRRRAVDCLRSAQAAALSAHQAAIRDHPAAFDEASAEAEARLERERVGHCLQLMTPPQRRSVLLAYFDSCAFRETADRLGTPLGTVKSRLRNGLIRRTA